MFAVYGVTEYNNVILGVYSCRFTAEANAAIFKKEYDFVDVYVDVYSKPIIIDNDSEMEEIKYMNIIATSCGLD